MPSYHFKLISHGGMFSSTNSFGSKVVLPVKRNNVTSAPNGHASKPKFNLGIFLIIIIIIRCSGMFWNVPGCSMFRILSTARFYRLRGTGQNTCYSGVNCALGPSKSIRYSGDFVIAGFIIVRFSSRYFTVILPFFICCSLKQGLCYSGVCFSEVPLYCM